MSDIEQVENPTPAPDGDTVEAAAAKIAQIKAGNEAQEPEVQLPEPELSPMSDDDAKTWQQHETQQQLESYRLQLANEQARLDQQAEDINALREVDPAEYSARLWEHKSQIDNFNHALGQYQAAINEVQNESLKEQQKEYLRQQEMLKQKIPGWDNQKKEKLVRYLMKQGYSKDQISSVNDHKVIVAFYQQMERKKVIPESARKKKLTKPRVNAHNDPALLQDLERRHES